MEREITKQLIEWKNRKNRKPLIIRGARQVGKTYAIEAFAQSHFTNYVKINFEEQVELRSIFKTPDVNTILDELSILNGIDITPGATLLFLDEIQVCPEAIIALRYFWEKQPDLHIVAAGSLLDFTLKEMNFSMPVGRIEFLYMYPMNFREFLIALSQNKLVQYIERYSLQEQFSDVIHQKLLEYLRLYIFIGGMPEAVETYLDSQKLIEVERIHANILTTLQYDFSKYGTKKQQEHLVSVLKYSARNSYRKVKYVNIDRDVRSGDYKEAFKRLEHARLLHLVHHTNAGGVPLENFVKTETYKPLFLDIGLMLHLAGIRLMNLDKLFTTNEGAIAEQFIGQELLTATPPFIDPRLYYWLREQRNSNAEIDYVYQAGNDIYPIEVKAGKSGALKSMHVYLFEKKLQTGIRFNLDLPSIGTFTTRVRSSHKVGEFEYTLMSFPLYMCFQLHKLMPTAMK